MRVRSVRSLAGPGPTLFSGAESGRPLKYRELSDRLRRGVLAGVWPAGERLPTERELVRSTGFSLNTVRRAVDDLVEAGLVERRQGAGTFVLTRQRPASRGKIRIGVMLPSTIEYFPTMLQGIESALRAGGASIELTDSQYESGREAACLEHLLEAGVDGMLLTPVLTSQEDPRARVDALRRLPVPVVLLERSLPGGGPGDRVEYVRSDYAGGAYDATLHLYSLGHRRVTLMLRAGSEPGAGVRAGYLSAVHDFSLPELPVQQASKEEWLRTGADGMIDRLLAAGATAALVFGDQEAALLTEAAARRKLSIPHDLALVSYDNETAGDAPVPLTAIDPPKHRVGRMAAQILLQRISEGDDCPVHQLRLRPRLVIRDSCGASLLGPEARL